MLVAVAMASAACGQEIVVVQCDGHVPDASDRDAGVVVDRDGGSTARDGGEGTPRDGGMRPRDGGEPDECAGAPYCIVGIDVSTDRATVREAVTFTAQVDNPNGAMLNFTVDEAEIVGTRRSGLPAFDPADVTVTLAVDGSGVATFTVNDVPTWYSTTRFTIRIHAAAQGGPDVSAEASVTIAGNVVFADGNDVYAVASDGAPATSVNFTFGRLLSGNSFVDSPADLLMARDGTLVVFDRGNTPERLKRFELSGENVLLGDFEFEEAGTPFLDTSSSRGMTQLDDGRFVIVNQNTQATPPVRLVVFAEDGTYQRSLVPTNNMIRYDGLAPAEGNTFLACETTGNRIVRIDPDSGAELDVFATQVADMAGITRAHDGSYYVGTDGSIARLTSTGARMMVNGVPGSTFDDWSYFAPFGPQGIVATTPVSSDTNNIVLVEQTRALGWFRQSQVGNPTRTPQGIAHLD